MREENGTNDRRRVRGTSENRRGERERRDEKNE